MPRVISPRGDTYEATAEEVEALLGRGYKLEGDAAGFERARAAGEEEAYSGIGKTIEAGVTGALRGATLGLSDIGADAEYTNNLRKYNSTASLVGEIGGSIAPALLSGGSSVLARTPAGLAARAGESLVAAGANKGALKSIAGYAAGGAAEGALQGAGSYISDVALGNRDLSAEAFLGSMGNGALWGSAIGGGFGALERGAVAARKLFPKSAVTKEAAQAARAEASSMSARLTSAGDEAEMVAARRIDEMRSLNPEADAAARNAAEDWKGRQVQARTREVEAKATTAEIKARQAEQKLATSRQLDEIKLAKAQGREPVIFDDVAKVESQAVRAADDAIPQGSMQDAIEDAMAAVDPDIAALVKAKRDYSFQRSRLPRLDGEASASGRSWKVAGHQNQGRQVLNDAELAETTLGRIKTALNARDVTEAQRAAVEKLLTPKRLSALKQLEEGTVEHLPYWFNKEHVFEGKTFRISDLVESDDILESRRLVHGVRSELEPAKYDNLWNFKESGGKLTDLSGAKPRVDQFGDVWDAELLHNIGVLGDFERTSHDLTRALGDAAPLQAQEMARDYAGLAAKSDDVAAESIAQVADHAEQIGALDNAKLQLEPTTATASNLAPPAVAAGDAQAAAARLSELTGTPLTQGTAEVAQTGSGMTSRAADAAAAIELLSSMEGTGLPSVHNIPVVGPLLSLYLKARAATGIFKRFGGKVGSSAETVVAGKAARMQDRVRQSLHKFLDGTEVIARGAARHGPRAAVQALKQVQYDDGKNRKPPEGVKAGTPAADMANRIDELQIAAGDEQAARRRIAEQVRASDPALKTALADKFMLRTRFLLGKAPLDPRAPSPWGQRPWEPSESEIQTFGRYLRFASDPGEVFDDLNRGELPREGIEVLQNVYPELYQYAQGEALDAMASKQRDLPYDRRVQISLMFGVLGDPTMAPGYVHAMQADYAANPEPEPGQGQAPPAQPGLSGDAGKVVSSYMTAFDRRGS